MINKDLKELKIGVKCNIDPAAHIGFEEYGKGRILIGDRVRVRPNAVLRTCSGTIVLSNDAVIGFGAIIHALGNVVIGEHVLISPNVGIYAQNHGTKRGTLIAAQDNVPGRVEIKKGAWVGASAVIIGPVVIGEGAIIGAGAVITHDVPDEAIFAGNPSKLIGYRR
jgi:acetyltransferase-like isoleucine patch superfamily enzyme